MHCTPTLSLSELNTLLDDLLQRDSNGIIIHNQELLEGRIMDQLACNSALGSKDVALESQRVIWQICQFMGTPFTICNSLMACLKRDGVSDMIIPIVDANWIPFELMCIIMEAGKEMEVGPLVFSVDKNDPDYRGCVYRILCAAIKKNWQAPVLFHDGQSELPMESVNLDWKKMLYFNSYELPHEPLESLMGRMLRSRFEDLTRDDWKKLGNVPSLSWETLRDDIYYVYCDLFEELDMNETFPLVKRYVIPGQVKEDILEKI